MTLAAFLLVAAGYVMGWLSRSAVGARRESERVARVAKFQRAREKASR